MASIGVCACLVLAGISGTFAAHVNVSLSNASPPEGASVRLTCSYSLSGGDVARFLSIDRIRESDKSWKEVVSLDPATNNTGGLPLPSEGLATSSGGLLAVTLADVDCSTTARYKCQLALQAPNSPAYTQIYLDVKDARGETVTCDCPHVTYSLVVFVCSLALGVFSK